MKYRLQIFIFTAVLSSLAIGLVIGLNMDSSHPVIPVTGHVDGDSAYPVTEMWTCSMHPQIQRTEPGDCPICGMDLIPLETSLEDVEGSGTMSMSKSARALAKIQTTKVQRDFPEAQLRMVGSLDYDETREKSLTARFPARIDRLFVNFTGVLVKPGEHLAEVYSPELKTAQREFLMAYRSNPDSSITHAAREKLRLWDLLPDQIDGVLESGDAMDHFELRAPIGGVVVSKNINEGDYVKTGQSLFRIVDLSKLWLNLNAYESDLIWLRYGQRVSFTVESFPGELFQGTITFINPELNRKTRTISIRVNVSNAGGRLKPGMFAQGHVSVRMAEGGKIYAPEFSGKWISPMHPEVVKDGPGQCDVCGMDLVPAEELGYVQNPDKSAPLIIPASSVLRTGKRAVVYVEKPDAELPTYEGREITLGPRAGDNFIVISGLKEGERVVSNGAFKIDSALQIQAKPSMMNPQGGSPSPGYNHGGPSLSGTVDHSQHQSAQMMEIPAELIAPLMNPYMELQAALAADEFEKAMESVKEMMVVSGHSGPVAELIHEMLSVDTLNAIRDPHFEVLSDSLIAAVKANPETIETSLYIMHCPMAMDGAGADWLQSSEPLQNPYYGAMMLKCGEIRETVSKSQYGEDAHAH